MRLEAKKYLYDVQRAAEQIVQFTAGKEFADYDRDPMMRLAVERAFTIIGEALAQLTKIDAPLAAQFSEYRRVIAFRNILIHAYAEIDNWLVWEIVQNDLPALHRQAAKLLREAEENQP